MPPMRHLRIAIICCAALALSALAGRPVAGRPAALYDAALGGTPDGQGMRYVAADDTFLGPPVAASQAFVGGLTALDTGGHLGDHAGYFADPAHVPDLDRSAGFTLTLRLQLAAEQHSGQSRAGLSLTVLANDLRGVEIGFWPDRVWAQSDSPLFSRAEEAPLDTTRLITYELAVSGERYTLSGGGATLSGPLRDYRAAPVGVYRTPDLIFLGDNTASAGALARIVYVDVAVTAPPPGAPAYRVALPLVARP